MPSSAGFHGAFTVTPTRTKTGAIRRACTAEPIVHKNDGRNNTGQHRSDGWGGSSWIASPDLVVAINSRFDTQRRGFFPLQLGAGITPLESHEQRQTWRGPSHPPAAAHPSMPWMQNWNCWTRLRAPTPHPAPCPAPLPLFPPPHASHLGHQASRLQS